MTTALTHTGVEISILDCITMSGWLVQIGDTCYLVQDHGRYFTFAKDDEDTVYNVSLHQGVYGCNCPGGKYRGRCKHADSAKEIMSNSW